MCGDWDLGQTLTSVKGSAGAVQAASQVLVCVWVSVSWVPRRGEVCSVCVTPEFECFSCPERCHSLSATAAASCANVIGAHVAPHSKLF